MFTKIFAVAACLFGITNAGGLYNTALSSGGYAGNGGHGGYGSYAGYGGYSSYAPATSYTTVTKAIPVSSSYVGGYSGAGHLGSGYSGALGHLSGGYSGAGHLGAGYSGALGHLGGGYSGAIGHYSGYSGAGYASPAISKVSVYRVHSAPTSYDASAYGGYGGYGHGYGNKLAW